MYSILALTFCCSCRLTQESKKELVKLIKSKSEKHKRQLRGVRKEIQQEIKKTDDSEYAKDELDLDKKQLDSLLKDKTEVMDTYTEQVLKRYT